MSHADRRLLAVALARAAETARDRQLAVGGLTAADEDPGSGNDPLQSLIEALAYLAEVLEVDLDEIADEAFIETSYDRATGRCSAGSGVLRPELRYSLRRTRRGGSMVKLVVCYGTPEDPVEAGRRS